MFTIILNGEFHRLYWHLRNFSEQIFEYLRISVETSNFSLNGISRRLQKQTTKYRQSISPTESLFVTIR